MICPINYYIWSYFTGLSKKTAATISPIISNIPKMINRIVPIPIDVLSNELYLRVYTCILAKFTVVIINANTFSIKTRASILAFC